GNSDLTRENEIACELESKAIAGPSGILGPRYFQLGFISGRGGGLGQQGGGVGQGQADPSAAPTLALRVWRSPRRRENETAQHRNARNPERRSSTSKASSSGPWPLGQHDHKSGRFPNARKLTTSRRTSRRKHQSQDRRAGQQSRRAHGRRRQRPRLARPPASVAARRRAHGPRGPHRLPPRTVK